MIQVRPSTYRGRQGFTISGRPPGQVGGWPVRIFTETRSSAEWIRAKVNRGERIDLPDFQPREATS